MYFVFVTKILLIDVNGMRWFETSDFTVTTSLLVTGDVFIAIACFTLAVLPLLFARQVRWVRMILLMVPSSE